MSGRHDVFVVDECTATVKFTLVGEHGHPRVLVYVCRNSTDDSVLFTQSSTSLNTHTISIECIYNTFISSIYWSRLRVNVLKANEKQC